MINIIVKVPTGFTVALPPADVNGNSTATPLQQEVSDAITATLGIEWSQQVFHTATESLYCIISQAKTLSDVETLLAKYSLPITILHAQESDSTMSVDANNKVTEVVAVLRQAKTSDLLPFMDDINVTDLKGKVISTKKATSVELPSFGGHAAWSI